MSVITKAYYVILFNYILDRMLNFYLKKINYNWMSNLITFKYAFIVKETKKK